MRRRLYDWNEFNHFLEFNDLTVNDADDFIEGCMQDNYLFKLERYTVFAFEKYLNEWSSCIEVLIVPNLHKNVLRKYYNRWNWLISEIEGGENENE